MQRERLVVGPFGSSQRSPERGESVKEGQARTRWSVAWLSRRASCRISLSFLRGLAFVGGCTHNSSLVINRSVAAKPVLLLYSWTAMVVVTIRSDSTSQADCHVSSTLLCRSDPCGLWLRSQWAGTCPDTCTSESHCAETVWGGKDIRPRQSRYGCRPCMGW